MEWQTMYPAAPSLATQLVRDISAVANSIQVADASVFPDAPNYATIGTENDAEVILYEGVDQTNGRLTEVARGQSGTVARSWQIGADVYHSWTSGNANAIMGNIRAAAEDLETARQVANRIYPGIDLSVRFAAEIAEYGDIWAWIKARIQVANFTGIHVGDYIPFVAGGNTIKAEVAGIDTYYNYGDTPVGHHIDFISRGCWPEPHVWNKVNYNNGLTAAPNPWMCSDIYAWLNSLSMQVPNAATADPATVSVNYTTTGVYDKLPTALKNVIAQKRALVPHRFTAGSLLIDDNSWDWQDIGNLWLPSEVEVCGCKIWGAWETGGNGFGVGGYVQYPIFAQNMRRIKGTGGGGDRASWWLSTPLGGGSNYCGRIISNGGAGYSLASGSGIHAPLCFRIA